MQGRARLWIIGGITFTLLTLSSCRPKEGPSAPPPPENVTPLGSEYEPGQCGLIRGQVKWNGSPPKIEPFVSTPYPVRFPRGSGGPEEKWPNPHVPQIDDSTQGVANAVIWLKGVDLKKSHPWEHGHVRVEQKNHRYQIHQGPTPSRIGFVRRGSHVQFISRDREFYSLRARGASFFSVIFPEPNDQLMRRLDHVGRVELRSGVGHYWMRAHLFVTEHPYFVRTDAQGNFTLSGVPAGTYEIICWMPNWNVIRREKDWETALVSDVDFAEPVTLTQSVTVTPGRDTTVSFPVSPDQFRPQKTK